MARAKFFYGHYIVGACMVTQMMYLGLFFTFGVLFPEFEKEFGWSRAQISGASSTMFIVMGLLGIAMGRINDRIGPRILLTVSTVVFALGFILDFIEITFVVVPIVAPVLLAMGVDPVWLGIMLALNLQTSFLTPPFGFALFYLRGVAPPTILTSDIYRGVVPFIIIQIVLLIGLAIWPELATWLPETLYS